MCVYVVVRWKGMLEYDIFIMKDPERVNAAFVLSYAFAGYNKAKERI